MQETINIPESRIGVLVGTNGEVKKKIARETGINIEIDSQTGEVFLEGEGEKFFKAADIVKAIARGFSPQRAYTLFKPDYLLKILEISDYTGKNASAQKAKRGRVIGRKGTARKIIEQKTQSLISVQGKTVAIIAKIEYLEAVVDAVEELLQGYNHEITFGLLEKHSKERFEL
jgi:ribosomal RNA assembly protein